MSSNLCKYGEGFDELKIKAEAAFHKFFEEFPLGTIFIETSREGGRNFTVNINPKFVYIHTAFQEAYTLCIKNNAFCLSVFMGAKLGEDELSNFPDYHEKFNSLLAWALSNIPHSIARNTEWKNSTDELLLELERVFPPHGLDGGISVSQTILHDDYEEGDLVQMQKSYAEDETGDWRKIPMEQVPSWMSIAYLDQNGWKYYLPAMLRSSLLKQEVGDLSPILETQSLTVSSLSHKIEYLALSQMQCVSIAKILAYLEKINPDYYEKYSATVVMLCCHTNNTRQ